MPVSKVRDILKNHSEGRISESDGIKYNPHTENFETPAQFNKSSFFCGEDASVKEKN